MPTMREDEIVKALNEYGPSAVVDLCLPSRSNSIATATGRAPASLRDPLRDSYLARTLAIHVMGDWIGSLKKITKP